MIRSTTQAHQRGWRAGWMLALLIGAGSTASAAEPDAKAGVVDTGTQPGRAISLHDALRLARARSPDLRSAELGQEIARIDARRARLDRYTAQLSLGAAGGVGVVKPWNQEATTGADAGWDGHATVTVPIWAGGAHRAATDSADAGRDIATLDRTITERALLRATYTAYWNIKGYELQIEAAQEGLDLTQQALDIIAAKADAGLAAGIDVNRSKVDLYSQQESLVQQRASMEQAREELTRLLQLESGPLTLTDEPPTPSTEPVRVNEAILAGRPELQRRVLEARQADDAIRTATSAALPQIGLTGTAGGSASAIGVSGSALSPDNLGPDLDASVGVQLIWNPFDLWRVRDAVDQARLRGEQVNLGTEREQLQLTADLRQAATHVGQLRERAPLVDAQVALARDNLQIVQGLYGQGSATILDLFNAQASFRSARTQGASLRVQLATAEWDLRWLVGEDLTATGSPTP